jgi:hypothetical protein
VVVSQILIDASDEHETTA